MSRVVEADIAVALLPAADDRPLVAVEAVDVLVDPPQVDILAEELLPGDALHLAQLRQGCILDPDLPLEPVVEGCDHYLHLGRLRVHLPAAGAVELVALLLQLNEGDAVLSDGEALSEGQETYDLLPQLFLRLLRDLAGHLNPDQPSERSRRRGEERMQGGRPRRRRELNLIRSFGVGGDILCTVKRTCIREFMASGEGARRDSSCGQLRQNSSTNNPHSSVQQAFEMKQLGADVRLVAARQIPLGPRVSQRHEEEDGGLRASLEPSSSSPLASHTVPARGIKDKADALKLAAPHPRTRSECSSPAHRHVNISSGESFCTRVSNLLPNSAAALLGQGLVAVYASQTFVLPLEHVKLELPIPFCIFCTGTGEMKVASPSIRAAQAPALFLF
eukprot:766244-Hanusia_phi.AAC.2